MCNYVYDKAIVSMSAIATSAATAEDGSGEACVSV